MHRILTTLLPPAALLALASHVPAAQVTYELLTDPSAINHWPGPDGRIGTADDTVDGSVMSSGGSFANSPGSLSFGAFDFGDFPVDDMKLPAGFEGVTFIQEASIVFDAAAGSSSPLLISFDIVSGTEPFNGHGPYSAQTTGPTLGTSSAGTFAMTSAPYLSVVSGTPVDAFLNLSGTFRVVDPDGAPTGDPYLDSYLTPIAQANNAESYIFITATGSTGNYGDIPISITMVGIEPIPEPSTPILVGSALATGMLRRRRSSRR